MRAARALGVELLGFLSRNPAALCKPCAPLPLCCIFVSSFMLKSMESVRTAISSGSPWETVVGVLPRLPGGQFAVLSRGRRERMKRREAGGDLAAQVRHSIEKMRKALDEAGSSLYQVVRTRMFVTDISRWEIAPIHAEFFGEVRPATSMVEVSKLIGEGIEFEIEAVAVIP